jgi:hypothetical protein
MQDVQNENSAYFVGWIPNNVLTARCDVPPSFTTLLCFLCSLIYSTRDFNYITVFHKDGANASSEGKLALAPSLWNTKVQNRFELRRLQVVETIVCNVREYINIPKKIVSPRTSRIKL